MGTSGNEPRHGDNNGSHRSSTEKSSDDRRNDDKNQNYKPASKPDLRFLLIAGTDYDHNYKHTTETTYGPNAHITYHHIDCAYDTQYQNSNTVDYDPGTDPNVNYHQHGAGLTHQ